MKTLATLVSQQIWPQLHALPLLRPEKLLLLHSNNRRHGVDPAHRLQTQLQRWYQELQLDWAPRSVECLEVSDHNFSAIQQSLDQLTPSPFAIHLTGGNKLMGFAAFEWARRQKIPVYYREREQGFVKLTFSDSETLTENVPYEAHLLDAMDPCETVRCQIEEGEIERNGELVLFNEKGLKSDLQKVSTLLQNGNDCTHLMDILGEADTDPKKGDRLELQTAAALLALGIPMVTRSLRLRARGEQPGLYHKPFQEIDLLFHHGGRLWLVDCKDIHQDSEYNDGGYRHLKEDVFAARNTGGLDARILLVRRAKLTSGQRRFVEDHGISYINRYRLIEDLTDALHLTG